MPLVVEPPLTPSGLRAGLDHAALPVIRLYGPSCGRNYVALTCKPKRSFAACLSVHLALQVCSVMLTNTVYSSGFWLRTARGRYIPPQLVSLSMRTLFFLHTNVCVACVTPKHPATWCRSPDRRAPQTHHRLLRKIPQVCCGFTFNLSLDRSEICAWSANCDACSSMQCCGSSGDDFKYARTWGTSTKIKNKKLKRLI